MLRLQLFKNDGEQNKNNDYMSVRKIQEAIENMSNEERWKLLEEMFYQYFNKDDLPKAKLKFFNFFLSLLYTLFSYDIHTPVKQKQNYWRNYK